MQIYITKNGERLGPYTLQEAQNLVGAGSISATDFAWYEGLADWIPLTQVPGFTMPAGVPLAPPQPAKRPVLVWIICLLIFCCSPFSLLSILISHNAATGTMPVPEAQRHFFESQTVFDYALVVINVAVTLTWAVLFFMLRRVSLYVFAGALLLSVAVTIYNIVAKDWLDAVGVAGLIGAGVGWGLNLAILYYNWHLCRKGILR
jgi:hypothetical protein